MSKLIREKGADLTRIRSFPLRELLADRCTTTCDETGCLVIPGSPATSGKPGSVGAMEVHETELRKTKEELDQEAYEEGFDQGHRDGLELARREMASKVEGLGKLLQDLSGCKATICAEAEAQLVELTLALAEAVIRHEVSCGSDTVRETLEAALNMAGEHRRLRVRLHPEDLENIMQFLPEFERRLGAATQVELEGDLAISQGGCLVETDAGIIDARLEAQLEVLRKQLRRTSELRRQAANSERQCD